MTIIYSCPPPRIETRGADFWIMPYECPGRYPATIRVGTHSARAAGPLGTSRWTRGRHGLYQEVQAWLVPEAIIRVHDMDVHCYQATVEQLELLDATFALVPPDHLQRVIAEKTEGFRMVSEAGRGGSTSHMGGLNAATDYPETPYDERLAILITYGALWENRHLGICPTVFHEIGHVMTHRGNGLSYATFDEARAAELRGTQVSRNTGAMEALCNAYMYLLCYGATDEAIREYGTRPPSPQKDRRTRDALRRLPAFTRLPPEWQSRYAER